MASDEGESVMSKSSGSSTKPSAAPLYQPSLPWRMTSSLVMGLTAALSKCFLYTFNTVEVTGLERFLDILDKRKDVEKRERGLITVSNHISVLDDPLMWGVLPLRYAFNPSNMRWGLGAHDICYKNKALGAFFYCGQVLPTHRGLYSPHGGLFQPTIPQAIRLLSSEPFVTPGSQNPDEAVLDYASVPDPFSSGGSGGGGGGGTPTFTTTGADRHASPWAYAAANRHGWVHVFPEARVHQHPQAAMRYFKWGVSRLILESEPAPDVVPVFIDGAQRLMPEDRGFPRSLPRAGARVRVGFGDLLDAERTFGDLRRRWRELVARRSGSGGGGAGSGAAGGSGKDEGGAVVSAPVPVPVPMRAMGDLDDELKYGREAVEIRVECARRVRAEVAKLRRSLGYPDEEPGLDLAETWAREPAEEKLKSNNVGDGFVNKKEGMDGWMDE